jgi:hypothetical protein
MNSRSNLGARGVPCKPLFSLCQARPLKQKRGVPAVRLPLFDSLEQVPLEAQIAAVSFKPVA